MSMQPPVSIQSNAAPGQLAARLAEVRARILAACQQAQRDPHQVNLLAVSKTQTAEQVALCHQLGVDQFGENYVQEALVKQAALADLNLSWHFIGAIQSNKIKLITRHFTWVHSVSSLGMAEKISATRGPDHQPIQLCVQVNLDREQHKQGVDPHNLTNLIDRLVKLPYITLRGLMLLPAEGQTALQRLASFQQLADLLAAQRNRAASEQHPLDILSMGMSADLEQAIAAGSHWVRVGSALFGPRIQASSAQ